MLLSVRLKLKPTPPFSMELSDTLVLDTVSVMPDMLDTHMPTVSMDIPMPMLLDTLTSAPLPVPALLDLPPPPSQPLLEDTLVPEDTSPTPPESFMLLSVRLKLKPTPPFSMELSDTLVLDTVSVMPDMLDTHMPMVSMDIPMPMQMDTLT